MFIHEHVLDSLKVNFNLSGIRCDVAQGEASRVGKNFKFILSNGCLSKSFNVAVFENPFASLMGPAAWVVVSPENSGNDNDKKRFGFQYQGACIKNGQLDMASVYADRLRCSGVISAYMRKSMGKQSV